MKKKDILFVISCVFLVIVIGIMTFLLLRDDKKELIEDKKYVVTGIVTNINNDYLIVKDITDGSYYSVIIDSNNYNIGDTIVLQIDNYLKDTYPIEVTLASIEIVEKAIIKDEEVVTNGNKNDIQVTTEKPSVNNVSNEEEVITYFKTLNNDLDSNDNSESFISKLKSGFVTCVDFLFYGGKIKDYTFEELSDDAKIKILEIMLTIDEKVDNKIPGYKDKITETTGKIYNKVKEKVVEIYVNITDEICTNNPDLCDSVRNGFEKIKTTFNLTWDFIKNATSSGLDKLSKWYLKWREQ